jgi:tRNA (cmo5U34)-methyltransferase
VTGAKPLQVQFAPDDGARLDQLKAIRVRLKPDAPFLMVHPATDAWKRAVSLKRYIEHARLMGAEEELTTRASEMVETQVHLLSPAREEELLREAGFTIEGEFYRGLWVYGWEATA